MYLGLGKLANELIARALSYMLSTTAGANIRARATPYLIVVEYGNVRKRPNLEKALDVMKNGEVFGNEAFLVDSELFRYKFVQTAKLAGVVNKKATVTKNNTIRLINFYRDSPIFDETLRDINKNRFDYATVKRFFEDLHTNKVRISTLEGIQSPFGEEVLKAAYRYRELLVPEMPSESAIKEFEEDLMKKKVQLICTYCGFDYEWKIANADKKVICPSCSSPLSCTFSDERKRAVDHRRAGKKMSPKDSSEYANMIKEAGLVDAYGNRAVLALSTYGVGMATRPHTEDDKEDLHRNVRRPDGRAEDIHKEQEVLEKLRPNQSLNTAFSSACKTLVPNPTAAPIGA